MIKIKPKFFVLLFLCSAISIQAEEMVLEVIPLKYRLTDDVIPILTPLVAPGGAITGMNNQLIIKTTPDNLADIKNILQTLDRSPRRLLITVKQAIGDQIQSRENAISASYISEDVAISSGKPVTSGEGAAIIAQKDGVTVRYDTIQSRTDVNEKNTFQVQATEGYPAFIQTGRSVPIRSRSATNTVNTIEYHEATSGFYVIPRLNGDRVNLLVTTSLDTVNPGPNPVFDIRNVETTAIGRLGEWIRVGNINTRFTGDSRQNLSSAKDREQRTYTILIKVDEIR